MTKKPAKKSALPPEYDSQRETNVLLEKIHADVKTVAEGHGILKNEIGKINNKLE